jgi:hypothetical protein
MPKEPLYYRLYFRPAYHEAARIIGYAGCSPFEFWDAAKKLGIPQEQLQDAVYDLTRTDRREASPPRYEFTTPARALMFQLLGPPPEHPLHGRMGKGPPLDSEEEQRQWRERLEAKKRAEQQGEAQTEAGKKSRRQGRGQ